MASHASAEKRNRQNQKRRERNKHVRTTTRTIVKELRAAIAGGDGKAAEKELREAISTIDRAVSKGVIPHRSGSRKIARLSAQVAKLSAK